MLVLPSEIYFIILFRYCLTKCLVFLFHELLEAITECWGPKCPLQLLLIWHLIGWMLTLKYIRSLCYWPTPQTGNQRIEEWLQFKKQGPIVSPDTIRTVLIPIVLRAGHAFFYLHVCTSAHPGRTLSCLNFPAFFTFNFVHLPLRSRAPYFSRSY